MDEDLHGSLVVEFLARLALDRAEGRTIPLREYLDAFPGADEAVAAAWLAAIASGDGAAQGQGEAGADRTRIGHYRIEREIGHGAQATVYLARDERLGRSVALKVAPRSPFSEEHSPRFRREAELAASLDHPGICPVFDMGSADGVEWIALRYVEGETLAQRIARAAPAPLPVHEVVRIGEQAARALHVAHEAGVVHRDVKPSNLMVTPRGDVVVLDFGVARHEESDRLTLTAAALGTPAYMAPEAFTTASTQLGRSVDVWGLGATLYEALTGRRPFTAPTRDALCRAILSTDPAKPRALNPELPRDLSLVLETALTKETGLRYGTALDLAEDLRRVREHRPILARPAGPIAHVARFCRRNPALAGSLAALLCVLAVGLAATGALLVDTRRALREKEALVSDFTQVADQKVARDLIAREQELWPAVPERAPRLRAWLAEARDVLARRGLHQELLARPARGEPLVAGFAPSEAAWLHEQLEQLLADLDRLEERVPRVEWRLGFVDEVKQRTIDDFTAEWQGVRDRIRADARFGGLDLDPQLGLVPLGPDPDSGLEEFAVLATGRPPARDAATRRLVMQEDMALVLVLLPGGEAVVGARSPDAEHPLGTAYVDPKMKEGEGPVVRVPLDPFFISKYELTQGQWLTHTGENPSSYKFGASRFIKDKGLLHPLETVSQQEGRRVLAQLQLDMPTDVQWEYAARAGTTTIFYTGDDVASLQGAVNLADRYAYEDVGETDWSFELSLHDGYTAHAPVGSFRPNAFGLHDMLGNLFEWCRDPWEAWNEVPPRPGDGFVDGDELACATRGGSYTSDAVSLRSASRTGLPPHIASYGHGFRPVRRLDPPVE